MKILDKLILVLLAFPPLYFAYRFIRWYVNTEPQGEENGNHRDQSETADRKAQGVE